MKTTISLNALQNLELEVPEGVSFSFVRDNKTLKIKIDAVDLLSEKEIAKSYNIHTTELKDGGSKTLSIAEKEEIVRLYKAGAQISEIMRDFKRSRCAIRRVLILAGTEIRDDRRVGHYISPRISNEEKKAIKRLYDAGLSKAEIAKKLNITWRQVSHYVDKYITKKINSDTSV